MSQSLSADERNAKLTLVGYRTYGVSPTEISIDLWDGQGIAPIDLYRALFQAAAGLAERKFSKVHLARSGRDVFILAGDDFSRLGSEYSAGQNPVYLIRTLPEKLHLPDGSPAYGTWTGGWLGVMGKQMEDVNDAAEAWASGSST